MSFNLKGHDFYVRENNAKKQGIPLDLPGFLCFFVFKREQAWALSPAASW